MQPTGDVHLGSYLGALRNWVSGQHECDAFHGIVDLHALTVIEEPGLIGELTVELAAMFFAIGLDPDVATVFVQSHVPEHNQLGWIMECTVSYGELSRMTQFKDKSSKREGQFISAGLFTYPALQAGDILPTRCRSATTSASTSRSRGMRRSASTIASVTPSWSPRRSRRPSERG
jgi:tryptophanyl-tRNA synthetase